jgi:hypothetical protein
MRTTICEGDVTPYTLVGVHRSFEGIDCMRHQGRRICREASGGVFFFCSAYTLTLLMEAVCSKYWHTFTSLHGARSQKTILCINVAV